MLNSYVNAVRAYPILMAMIQFAILGTLGDVVAKWIIKGKVHRPFRLAELAWKALVWMVLAVLIKYAFVGTKGFIDALVAHHYLPALSRVGRAFAVSTAMNLQFGFFMVIMHRVLDNVVMRPKNWAGLDKGLISLCWFWIPAHTVTFSLPPDFQIGLAALWSVALGVILGLFNRPKSA